MLNPPIRRQLQRGLAIPASPLAVDANRTLDQRRQKALWRYYSDAGAGGLAIGVHTTQFAIREPNIGLYQPLLQLAEDEFGRLDAQRDTPLVRVAGICGRTDQALNEAEIARETGFHLGLLSLSAMQNRSTQQMVQHCRRIGEVLPVFAFYLQPAVGGMVLAYEFWRELLEVESVTAIKVAAFNRYQTIDVVRAVAESGRTDVALYTGNDDNIVMDLLTPYRFCIDGRVVELRFVGGLLGHWACWTKRAVELLDQCRAIAGSDQPVPEKLLQRNIEVTDANAVLFDAAHHFAGCIPGIHEVLRRQGLLEGSWCLDDQETLSPGQASEIDRIYRFYPHLTDDAFVSEHLERWLAD